MSIGRKIKERRLALNMTQEELATMIGATKQAVYKYENDIVTNIPIERIKLIASALGVTPDFLTGWSNDESRLVLTDHEKSLIEAYRKNPAMQTAVDKLLGIETFNSGGDVLQDMAAQLSINLPRSNSTIKQK